MAIGGGGRPPGPGASPWARACAGGISGERVGVDAAVTVQHDHQRKLVPDPAPGG